MGHPLQKRTSNAKYLTMSGIGVGSMVFASQGFFYLFAQYIDKPANI